MSSATDRTWAIIGKVALVVGVLVGISTLYRSVHPDAARLGCRCQVYEFEAASVFQDTRDQLAECQSALMASSVEKQLRATALGSHASDIQILEAVQAMTPVTLQTKLSDAARSLAQRRVFSTCDVTNTGEKEAKDVILTFPFAIKGAAIDGRRPGTDALHDKSLNLGPIRPGATIKIFAWSTDYVLLTGFNDFLLTHTEGRGSVEIGSITYGRIAAVAQLLQLISSNQLSFVVLVVVPTLLLIIVVYLSRRRAASSDERRS